MQLKVVRYGNEEFIYTSAPRVKVLHHQRSGSEEDRYNGKDHAIVRTITDEAGDIEFTHRNPFRNGLATTMVVCRYRADARGVHLLSKKEYTALNGNVQVKSVQPDPDGWEHGWYVEDLVFGALKHLL